MIRKDPAQDTDRAHYYSQFWIEVAAGRPIGQGNQETSDDEELEETDFDVLMGATPVSAPPVETKPKPKAVEKKDTARSLSSLADLASIADLMSQSAQMEDEAVPEIEAGATEEPEDVTDFGYNEVPETEVPGMLASEEEEPLDEFEEEEEEEDDEWSGTRRPKPKKPPRRDRRGF